MAVDPLTAILSVGESVIERIWPDANKRSEEIIKLKEIAQKGDLALLEARVKLLASQLEVNKTEAEHKSLWVAGWRPGIGWVCVVALAISYIPKAVLMTIIWARQCFIILSQDENIANVVLPMAPDLGISDLIGLMGSMLGIGLMRSVDKYNRVETNNLSKPR